MKCYHKLGKNKVYKMTDDFLQMWQFPNIYETCKYLGQRNILWNVFFAKHTIIHVTDENCFIITAILLFKFLFVHLEAYEDLIISAVTVPSLHRHLKGILSTVRDFTLVSYPIINYKVHVTNKEVYLASLRISWRIAAHMHKIQII